jgi:hypothetical protein
MNFTHSFKFFGSCDGHPRLRAMAAPLFLPTSAALAGTTGLRILHSPIVRIANNGSSMVFDAKKMRGEDGSARGNDNDGAKKGILTGVFKKSPGVIFVAPFILIFGLDLIANIAVDTKRSLEVLFTGEYTVWTPWQ